MIKYFYVCCLVFVCFAQLNGKELIAQKQVSDIGGVIWGMTFLNRHQLLVTLKSGKIKRIDLHNNTIHEIPLKLDVWYEGQGGLLDIQKSPHFAQDHYIYVTYVKRINQNALTVLARSKFLNERFEKWEDLLITKSSSDTSRHFGSRITFDDQNHLFFTVGDRGVRANAQNQNNHAGTTIRLNLDGTTPNDNPFIKNRDVLNEIYSFGHRNAQGIDYDSASKKLFLVEHGPRGGDEINIISAKKNYGWPTISYGKEYWNPFPVGIGTHKEGMEQPIKVYIPSIAPSSLIMYRGERYKMLQNRLLIGALKLQHINVITLNKNLQAIKETRLFEDLNERIRCIVKSSDDFLYFSTDGGNLYKIIQKD